MIDETNGESTVYARGLGLLSRTNQNGTQYYHFNIHGDTSALTDSNGEIVLDYRYDAFGNQLKSNENDTNPFRYNGEYFDEETGFVYLRNRYYDPSIGRFITEDPACDGTNWYIYCGNNPVIFIDPEGLESYVFYTSTKGNDFSSQAQWQKEYLESLGETVIMLEVNNVDEFTRGWNSMGTVNGKTVSINKVVIYSHGNERGIIFENGSDTNAMTVNGKNKDGSKKTGNINDLQAKEIKEVNLLSCNSGNVLIYYNKGKNAASVLSKKVINGNLYAYDGNVSFGKPSWAVWESDIGMSSRLATNQSGFYKIANDFNSNRKPLGKVTYNNGEYKPYGYYPNTSISGK